MESSIVNYELIPLYFGEVVRVVDFATNRKFPQILQRENLPFGGGSLYLERFKFMQ